MYTNPKLTYLGRWNYSSKNIGVVNFYSLIDFNDGLGFGIILGGWTFNGWQNTSANPVNIQILRQNSNQTLTLSSIKTADLQTNGEGSVIVYDFNKDGKPDIFLAAHNESPLIPSSSTVYLSQSDGTYSKVTLKDSILAHDATLGFLNGVPTVVTCGYGPQDPYYQFNSKTNTFDILYWKGTYSGSLYGSCALIADFNNDGNTELLIGDCKSGPGLDIKQNSPQELVVYKIQNGTLSDKPSFSSTLYFDQSRYQNTGLVSDFSGLTHNYRAWTDDINHDGLPDVLLGVGVWSAGQGWQKAKLEIFQNLGNLQFTDVTDKLAASYDENSSFVDYSMQIIDIDHSGISSYLLAGGHNATGSKQSNYIFLNDGTGLLYIGMHKEFQNWGQNGITEFIPYITNSGVINFLGLTADSQLYDVNASYNAVIDFKQNITVADRNQSMLMRTWAGNDTFYDTNANSKAAHIDGGLGTNASLYSDKSSAYTVTVNNSVEVKHTKMDASPNVDDTLVNIQKIQFSDLTLDTTMFTKTAALSSSQIVSLVELYIASFNRAPDSVGLDYWGSRLSDGMSLQDIAKSFFVQPETVTAYPTTMATSDFVTKVYNNVLSRGPDKGGLDYWVGELNTGHVTKDSFLLAIINGAMAATGSAVDRQTLANKESVGAYYALTQGLNNSTTWAKDVMSAVTDQMTTVTAANAKTDGYAAIAANPTTSDLVVKLVGVAV